MSMQIIDIGAISNDGTGDPLRVAFDIVNQNTSELYAALEFSAGGLANLTAWQTGTLYQPRQLVAVNFAIYRALVRHGSGDFATDLAAGKWQLVTDLPAGPQGHPGDDPRIDGGTLGHFLQSNGVGDPSYEGFLQAGVGGITRRWRDKVREYVSILDFGAVGDGDIANALVNATALNNALATGKTVLIPYTAAGYHFGTNTIVLGSGMNIVGENHVTLKSTTTTTFFSVTTYQQESSVSGVTIDGAGCGAASSMFRFRTDLGVVYRVRFDGITFLNCYEVFGDVGSVSNYIVDARFTNIRIINAQGRSIKFVRSRGFFYWENIQHDHGVNTGPVNWVDGYFADAVGLEIKRWDCSAGQAVTPVFQAGGYGLWIENSTSVWLERVEVDSTSGNGIFLNNIRFLRMNFCSAFGNLGNQIELYSVTESLVSNSNITGAHGFPGDGSGSGLNVNGCSTTAFVNIDVSNCSASAMLVNNSTKIAISNYLAYGNFAYAFALLGTSDKVTLSNSVFDNNAAGAVLNSASGTKNRITNVVGYNPVGAAAITTSASPFSYTAGTSPETAYFSASTSITALTINGTSILPAAAGANACIPVSLGPNDVAVVTYTGTLTGRKMVH